MIWNVLIPRYHVCVFDVLNVLLMKRFSCSRVKVAPCELTPQPTSRCVHPYRGPSNHGRKVYAHGRSSDDEITSASSDWGDVLDLTTGIIGTS
jgi:hypothetical protein